jgi:CHAT domain-containing protein/Tfp pilus assembly protein PilF
MVGNLIIFGPDGRELEQAELGRRSSPASKAFLIPPGAARLVVRPANHSQVERIFEIHTGEYRPLGEQDRLRIQAERRLGEGEHAFRHKTPGFREAALADYEKSLEIWTQLGDRLRQGDALCHIGRFHYELGDIKPSAESYDRALQLFRAEKDRAGEASALYGKARAALDTGDFANGERWSREALAIRQSLGDLRGQPEILYVLWGIEYVRGQYAQCRTDVNAALSISQQSGDRLDEALALNGLGVLESQLGNGDAALAEYSRALQIDRDEDEPVQAAQALSNLATEYGKAGDNRQAVRALEQVLPIRKAVAARSSYANTVYNLAVSRKKLGEYDLALDELREALGIYRQTNGPRGEAHALDEIGKLYLDTGEPDQAETFLREAAAKWRAISDRQGEVLALNSLAQLAMRRGGVSKAGELLGEALEITRAAGLQREQEATLLALSSAALAAGDARPALEDAGAARELSAKIPDRAGEADAAFEQGRAWRKLGDDAKARDAFAAALALDRQFERKPNQVEDLEQIAGLERDRAKVDAAVDLLETTGPDAGRVESRMYFSAAHRDLFDLAIDIHMQAGDTAGAFALSERARARGLATLLREPAVNIREGADPALLERERDLEASMDGKQQRLAQILARPHAAAAETQARANLDRIVELYRNAAADIRKNSPRYAALVDPRALSAPEVQAELHDSGTALVEYWLGAEHSYGWLITKSAVAGFELPGREAIENIARRAYAAADARNVDRTESLAQRKQRISAADAEFTRSMTQLSAILLGPIERRSARLSAIRRLWVVSDGALEYLPFAALPVPGTRTPLVASCEIVRLPSATVLAEMRNDVSRRLPAPRSVAIFADPVFRADDERVRLAHIANRQAADPPRAAEDLNLSNLPRLYFSRKEADAIAALARGSAREDLDFDASRAEAEKPSLSDYRVIHFATHALVDSKNPELSGLVFSMIDRQGRPEDGFLRLHEIYDQKLNADLVVLSACRTALGTQIQSEGLIGLTRGFMYAGAPQVLASLWSIRDNATTWFMKKFYAALLDRHQAPEAALRSAQLAMMQDSRWNQPYYWAAFTVQGAR